MRAITVCQPSAELICRGIKDVENRSRRTHIRGRVLIHAGLVFDTDIAQFARETAKVRVNEIHVQGAIIGAVEIVDCLEGYRGVWSTFGAGGGMDKWHWMLDHAVRFEKPLPCEGKQGWWHPPERLVPLINAQLPKEAA